METAHAPFDLDAYLARIGYAGARSPTAEVLAAVHLAHATCVPFENLDIHLGRPIRLDLESLQAKLVGGRCGGYCFEQNTLFAAALEALGFRVIRLAARVRLGSTRVAPRTHMLLLAEAGGSPWLADVGFGGTGLLQPLPLEAGFESRQFAWRYRLARDGELWVLRHLTRDGWQDQYAFTLEPQYPADYEVANHYTATHPASSFVRTLTVQRPTPEACYVLRGREFTVARGDESASRTVADGELLDLLAESFGLEFPPGTRFGGAGGA